MERLERSQGNFYNWYDTPSLRPLMPIFISTVDSGNLAGDLLTLRPGLLAIADEKILETRFFDGMDDTFRALLAAAQRTAPAGCPRFQSVLATAQGAPPADVAAARICIGELERCATEIAATVGEGPDQQTAWWALALA